MSAFAKIPLQIVVPLIGVLMFAYYVFVPAPLLFNGVHEARVRASARAADYAAVERQYQDAVAARRTAADAYSAARSRGADAEASAARAAFAQGDAAVGRARAAATGIVRDVTGDRAFGDTNYVFPTFVTTHMPIGLVGLIIAAIFAASMSTVAAELNSLATATVIDFYRRLFVREASDAHYLRGGQDGPPPAGASSPASWRCSPPTSDRSSTSSTASGRSSTGRSWGSSCWPWA